MKIRNIPAQITTVEDKIVGNLSLTQMILLMIPIFWFMVVYALFYPFMQYSWYKLPIFLIIGLSSLILALRIKEKIILSWLTILLRFTTRPKYYVLNKNDSYLRHMDVMSFDKEKATAKVKLHEKEKKSVPDKAFSIRDFVKLENLLTDPRFSFSIKSHKKGAVYVAFEQKQ